MKWILPLLIILVVCQNSKAQRSSFQDSSETRIPTGREVDIAPQFPGGLTAYKKFITKNIKWPKHAPGAHRKVIISFVIEKDGHLTDFKVERSLGKSLDTEAIRILKKSPKWIPGVKNEKLVQVKYFLPISFTPSDYK